MTIIETHTRAATRLSATALRNCRADKFTALLNAVEAKPGMMRDMLAILAGSEPEAFAQAFNTARDI